MQEQDFRHKEPLSDKARVSLQVRDRWPKNRPALTSIRLTCALVLLAVALTAATCNQGPPPAASGDAAPSPSPQTGSPAAVPTEDDRIRMVLSGIEGLDFSSLSPAAQKELASVFTDEFCPCGCPHTVGACLKTHPGCRHARRMALLAAPQAAAGISGTEIILELSQYHQSFRDSRVALRVDERMCRGAEAKDAKVTVVAFSDFECPYCGYARPLLEKLVQGHAAKGLRLCHAPFPLQGHPNALPAGQAVLFARDHGKFWQMHDLLFENQAVLTPGLIRQLAARIGLSSAELGKVLDSKRYLDELAAWKEAGRVAGVEATPALYFNGRKFTLPLDEETLAHTAGDELEWIANQGAWAAD